MNLNLNNGSLELSDRMCSGTSSGSQLWSVWKGVGGDDGGIHLQSVRKVRLHERTFETFGWVVPSVVSFLCACKPLTTSLGCLWNAGRRGETGTPPFASSCASLGGLCLRAEAGCCCRAEAVHSPARIRACYSCALPTVGTDRECGRQRSHIQPDPTCVQVEDGRRRGSRGDLRVH